MSKTLVGVDIGANELRLVVSTKTSIQFLPTVQMPENLVFDGRITSFEAMSELLQSTLKKHHIHAKACAIVLPSSLVFTRKVNMPVMSVEMLELNLPYEFHDYFQKDKNTYFYDYSVLHIENDEEVNPKTMDLLAAAVAKETIEEYRRFLSRAGLKMQIAIPESLAYRNIIMEYEEENTGNHPEEYCIIDLGHSTIRVYMFKGSSFETSGVIEFGGAAIDDIIADAMSVNRHQARTYKHKNHEDVQTLEACKELYSRIAIELQRTINFYGYNNPSSNLQDAYICGGLTQIPALMSSIGETISLKIHSMHDLMPALRQGLEADKFSVAVGVTLQ